MRYFIVLLIGIAAVAGGFLVERELAAGPPVVLPAPNRLDVTASGATLLPGGWTNSPVLTLSATTKTALASGVEAEIRPANQVFTGAPTAVTDTQPARIACAPAAKCTAPNPAVRVRLSDGRYHVRVRLHNGQGISPWFTYRGEINVDTQNPANPQVSSVTDPDPAKTYHRSSMRFAWQSQDTGSGVAGYSYALDTNAHSSPRTELRTAGTSTTLTGVNSGVYYFHVRAMDRAGNWGSTTTFAVRLDVTPPGLAHVRFSQYQFDPLYDSLRVSFAVTRPATSVHVGVYRQSDKHMVRFYTLSRLATGQTSGVTWDGKDAAGRPARAGSYEIFVRATDQYGHSSLTGWRDFLVNYQRIVVYLGQQKLYAYDGNTLLLSSPVTTGNPALPTPTGNFHVMAKFHPYTFISPWPKSSKFYYKPSKVVYALLFRDGGYFLHDAPWRSAFGPGTNQQIGTPGSNFTGTHGCINLPSDVASRLYAWAQIGTVVQVSP